MNGQDRRFRPLVRTMLPVLFLAGLMLFRGVLAMTEPADAPDGGSLEAIPSAEKAFEPAAPVLPGELVAALQEGRYEEAAKQLVELGTKAEPEVNAYHGLVAGIAYKQAGKLDEARAAIKNAIDADPNGRWRAKLRSELAAVELAAGQFATAEALARAEAEALVAPERKDLLAAIYRSFATQLLKPASPVIAPDAEAAYALLKQARELAKGEAMRSELLLAMAQASQQGGNLPRAIEDYQAFITQYGKPGATGSAADRASARLGLGQAQLDSGQLAEARATWDALIRSAVDEPAQTPMRARAMYLISRTHGVPQPSDDGQLRLAVGTLRRFLEAYPNHPDSVRAAYDIGAFQANLGKTTEALEAFRNFLKRELSPDAPETVRRERAELVMSASFEVGRLLRAQQQFDQAIAAFQDYLAKYPNGPQSAEAQRAILETRLEIAAEHERRERYADARAVWEEFVLQNPLDERVPELLYKVGASYLKEKPRQVDEAITRWETLAGKFPGTEPAAHGQFEIAQLFEQEKGQPETAIERYKKIEVEPWASNARQRVAVMEARALTVVTARAFRTGEKARLKITTRNLEKLTFTAYKLNPEAYFRKKHTLQKVEELDIGLVAPDAEWTAEVAGYAKFKPIEADYELDVEIPGVYVVKVTDDKHLQATTLVLGTDLEAVVKSSAGQILIFAQDMKTGKGRPGARVLVSDGSKVVLDTRTGEDGVALKDWEPDQQGGLQYLVFDDKHACGSGLSVPNKTVQALEARGYLYTDRPAYRPGQLVKLRGVVREVDGGQYAVKPGAAYRLEVTDPRGRPFLTRGVSLSDFGTFDAGVELDRAAVAGSYRVRLYQPGGSEFSGSFEVQAYQLQKVDLAFDLPRAVFYRGETVEGTVIARYQYGTPLAGRSISVALPDGRTLSGKTDDQGKYEFSFPTDSFAEQQNLAIVASLPEDGVAITGSVAIAVEGFGIELKTARQVMLSSEPFEVELTTSDALGEPVSQELELAVLKQISANATPDSPGSGSISEREVSRVTVKTDPKTGKATTTLKVDDEEGGSFLLRASGTDRFGNPIVANQRIGVSGEKDARKLRFLTDKTQFRVGTEAQVRLHSRMPAGLALLCWEADRILSYKLVPVSPGENAVAWNVDGVQFPNFTLTAAQMAESTFQEARVDLTVERELRVSIKPLKPAVAPGEEVEVEITATDQNGKPVKAEVGLALVDLALLRRFADPLPQIDRFFYDQRRTGAFATQATSTFRYQPQTLPVEEAVVEEQERLAALMQDGPARLEIAEQAKGQVMMGAPVQSIPAAPAAAFATPDQAGQSGLMGGMGGGMGGAGEDKLMRRKDSKLGMGAIELDAAGFEGEDFRYTNITALAPQSFFSTNGAAIEGRASVTRQAFVETAYWNPSVITGEDGKARVTFPAPTALSRYQFSARGATGADTLVGQTTAELAVEQDFFVELKIPAILTEGDRPQFQGRLHHKGVKGQVKVTLTIYVDGAGEQVFPQTIQVEKDGVSELLFDPYLVPDTGSLKLTVAAVAGGKTDQVEAEVPVRPWGVQAYASASGTSSNDTSVSVTLPAGRPYESPEMMVVLSPTVKRMLVELALGQTAQPFTTRQAVCFPPPLPTVRDRASELLAATSVLSYLKSIGGSAAPEAQRLTDRIRGIAAELVTLQNEDGGWPWISPDSSKGQTIENDAATSARATWALAATESLALLSDPAALDRATAYLEAEFARTDVSDGDTRAALLHAMSTRRRANFETANALNRVRDSLSDAALAYLSLTFTNLDRNNLAREVVSVLVPRAKREAAEPGLLNRLYWDGNSRHPAYRGAMEATALAALAIGRASPEAPQFQGAVEWLLAHRQGTGWQPRAATGPALAALAIRYGEAGVAQDRYRLVVTVNDQEVQRLDVDGELEGQVVAVPAKLLKTGGANRVRFDIEGRGTFGYAVTLTGFTRDFEPDQKRENRTAVLQRRIYTPAEPQFEGKTLPSGFGVAVGATAFENRLSQLPLGGRARVMLEAYRVQQAGRPAWEQDFLVVEEHLPAGATLVEGSVQTSGIQYVVGDGKITFYFTSTQWPGTITYDVFGYLPGQYRALPAEIRSAYDPSRRHLGDPGDLKVLRPGEKSTDPYRATPDELYARGKALFDAGRLTEAAEPLEALWGAYTLNDEVAREAARMLLWIHMDQYEPRKIVQYFEVLKEKYPGLVIPFDRILIVGRAYRDIGENERAYMVWRTLSEASYLEDARLGETLRQRGRPLEATALLVDLWRQHPNSASIQSDFFGISQLVASQATAAETDPTLRQALSTVGKTKSDLLLQSIRLVQVFLSQSPANPLADEASLALVGAFLQLEDFPSVVKLSERFAKVYPRSKFLDSFQYSETLGRFNLGEYDRAIEVAQAIASATYKDADGVEQPSPNKWEAIYIIGQIHDARRQAPQAVDYYKKVADRFTDAAEAVRAITRKELALPEVTVLRPDTEKVAAAPPAGLRAMPPQEPRTPPGDGEKSEPVTLKHRNIKEADVKVYPVDLMRLYLTRRSLDGIAGIDLAGITPLLEKTIPLGKEIDLELKNLALELPLPREGAYLVMVRGDDLYASGIALVTPLELEVLEEPDNGRVRVQVRNALTGAPAPKVQVKVIGSDNSSFFSGDTDLRGVYVAEGVQGQVTAVARLVDPEHKDAPRYAFHRGTTYVGTPPPPATDQPTDEKQMQEGLPAIQRLDKNVFDLNSRNQIIQLERLQQRYQQAPPGGASVEGFR